MGGWLATLLTFHGAEVHGYALEPPTEPSFFGATHLGRRIAGSIIGDVRDGIKLNNALRDARPEIIFHLAAQPLVRAAYAEPLETFSTNVMGTAQLLDCIRDCDSVEAVLVVTTDKVYFNDNRHASYSENDRLGGKEPYSASKAASELVVDAWRHSYLRSCKIAVATIRAGNIFGGGDWAADRLVPDAVRSFVAGQPLILRNPLSTRPWQHVLDPLPGYLALAERLVTDGEPFSTGWNFGPPIRDCRPVGELARMLASAWSGSASVEVRVDDDIFEEKLLALDSSSAESRLGWRSRWSLEQAVEKTTEWYRAFYANDDMWALTLGQIESFEAADEATA
jgi:CDP-glucose 4,6-dehydratase